MARRPGLKTLPFVQVETILRKERAEQRDVYAPLSALRLDIADPLAPPGRRYRALLREGTREHTLRLHDYIRRSWKFIVGPVKTAEA